MSDYSAEYHRLDGDCYAVVIHPGSEAYLSAPLSPKEKWHYERWAERYQRRYGVDPRLTGLVGSLWGVQVVDE